MNRIYLFLKKWLVDYIYYWSHVRKIGLSFKEYVCYVYQADDGKNELVVSSILDKKYIRTNTYWHVQNVLEIFNDQIYAFDAQNDSPYIIDCGSNFGLSIIYFKLRFPKAKIIAFEADPKICNISKENIKEHNFSEVQILNFAVWDGYSELDFKGDGIQGGSLIVGNTATTYKVPSVRLRDYLNQKVDFLKIDIEGAEEVVIRDCEDYLFNVEKIFLEYHSFSGDRQKLSEILRILENSGFRYYIQEAYKAIPQPFQLAPAITKGFDLQLNIFAFRK